MGVDAPRLIPAGNFVFEKVVAALAFRRIFLILRAIRFVLFMADAFGQPAFDKHGTFLAKPFTPLAVVGFGLQHLTEATLQQIIGPQWLHTYSSVFPV